MYNMSHRYFSNNFTMEYNIVNAFSLLISNLIFIAFSLTVSFGAYKFYNICPPAWFLEYGQEPFESPDPRLRKASYIFLYCSVFTFISYILFMRYDISLSLFSGMFSLIFLSFIFVSDLKTGIIPDQFVFALVFISLFWILTDISVSQMPPSKWYLYPLMRILGGIAGGGILFVIRYSGSKILKQEAMGMGDIKFIFASGLITGFPGIFAVLVMSFIIAFPFSIFKLLIKSKQSSTYLADRLPFGPFIVLSVILFFIFPNEIELIINWWISI